MVQHPSSLLRVLRRAIKIAATPPMGPVYVCLPQDMLDAPSVEDGAADVDSVDARRCPTPPCCSEAAAAAGCARRRR